MNSSATIMGQKGSGMKNPFKLLFPKQDELSTAAEEKQISREIEINQLKAKNQEKADEAAEAIRKLTHLVETEGISGVFFVATGADRRGRNKK